MYYTAFYWLIVCYYIHLLLDLIGCDVWEIPQPAPGYVRGSLTHQHIIHVSLSYFVGICVGSTDLLSGCVGGSLIYIIFITV